MTVEVYLLCRLNCFHGPHVKLIYDDLEENLTKIKYIVDSLNKLVLHWRLTVEILSLRISVTILLCCIYVIIISYKAL